MMMMVDPLVRTPEEGEGRGGGRKTRASTLSF